MIKSTFLKQEKDQSNDSNRLFKSKINSGKIFNYWKQNLWSSLILATKFLIGGQKVISNSLCLDSTLTSFMYWNWPFVYFPKSQEGYWNKVRYNILCLFPIILIKWLYLARLVFVSLSRSTLTLLSPPCSTGMWASQ